MPQKPPNKKPTQPGLGGIEGLRGTDSAEMKRVRDSFRQPTAPESAPPASADGKRRVRDSVRREDPDEPASPVPPPSARRPSWEPESSTGTRPKERSGRPPVAVDKVGAAAVKLAGTSRQSAPRLLATREVISKAPIDTRAAFVLSLIDGRNTIESIVDMSGMPDDEVRAIVARLTRLGLIAGS